jgi:hypothetical protein
MTMTLQKIMDIGITIDIIIFIVSLVGLIILACVFLGKRVKLRGKKPRTKPYRSHVPSFSSSAGRNAKNDLLPNGYSRQDYYDQGYTDSDIECWGMDQPGAPDPYMGGFAIADMADGKLDGKFDIFKK